MAAGLLLAILCATVCASCGRAPAQGDRSDSSTKPKPRRIVSQVLNVDEILLAICPRDRIVGVSKFSRSAAYSNVAAEVERSGLPQVEQAEDILRLKPDLVFVASYSQAEIVDLLKAGGAPVVRIANYDRVDDIIGNIRFIGRTIGEDAAAEQVIADMQRRLDRVRARVSAAGRQPTVMSYDTSGYTAGANTLFDDVIRRAGGTNVSATRGVTGFGRINEEQILAWKPEYLVCGAAANEDAAVRRRLLANPAIAASSVVKSGHLVLMDTRRFLTASQHVVDAVESLADALYGAPPPEPPR